MSGRGGRGRGGQYGQGGPFQGARGGRGGGRGGGGGGGGRGGGGSGYQAAASIFSIENAIQASKTSVDLSNISLADGFPARPSYGTKGSTVTIWANYFALKASPKLVLQRYDIKVVPEVAGKKRTQIVRLVLQTPELLPHKSDIVTDYKSTLLSRKKFGENELKELKVDYKGEDEDEPRENARQYTVTLKFTDLLDVSALGNYLTSTNFSSGYAEKLPMIQGLNIFLNHYAKSAGNLATIGASKTFTLGQGSDTYDLGGCLVAMRGFFASVRAATARVLVNVNVSHGAFYTQGPLDRLITQSDTGGNLFRLEAFIKRLRVKTTHLKERKNKSGKVIVRAKTIFGLANRNDGQQLAHPPRVRAFGAGPRDVEFWLDASPPTKDSPAATPGKKKGGKTPQKTAAAGGYYISVYDHFRTAHNRSIANPRLPVVNVGNRENPSYLPAEVCFVQPGQPARTKLDPDQTKNMIQFAVRGPADNANSIVMKGRQTAGLSSDANPLLGQFGISVSPDLITVQGRVLPGPKVVYKQNRTARTADGSWNMVPKDSPKYQFSTGTVLQNWSCLYVDMGSLYPRAATLGSGDLSTLMRGFQAVLQQTGINAGNPHPPQRVQLRDNDDPALEGVLRSASALKLLFVILPASPIPLYNRIKQLGDVKYGIHTICSVGTKITKPAGQDQYFRNEALKVNLKLGGNNHLVDPVNLGLIAEDKTMVVGIDVTHPSPSSSSKAPSVAGMVASIDSRLGQWPGVLSVQTKARQEMVSNLELMLKSRLTLWKTKGKHTAYPENILVYRDGVSEGQYDKVLEDELPLLRAACQKVYPASDQKKGLPRITIIIVGKRHHTRFYPTKETDADRSGNTRSGTVVDRGVTEARSWDFFLQAHAALKGTARPAHYFVILDEIFRQRYASKSKTPAATKNIADELQELTQSMSYLFGRATKAVSYCTPAYYADILCERARCYLTDVFDTPNQSSAGSTAGSNTGTISNNDVKIHDRLIDSMFYI